MAALVAVSVVLVLIVLAAAAPHDGLERDVAADGPPSTESDSTTSTPDPTTVPPSSTEPPTTPPAAPPTTAPPTTAPPTTASPPPTAPPPPPPTTAAPSPAPFASGNCDSNYGGCVPVASDVDCEGGGGNGPEYVRGPVQILGADPYDLDRDGNGIGCEDD